MALAAPFPARQDGLLYLTEGGQETELMYRHGHDLPSFALYPLLDDPRAVADLTAMYTRYLEVAAQHGFAVLAGGLDYRASADWAAELGLSPAGLADYQLRSIDFLRTVSRPFAGQVPQILVSGVLGPRRDAYEGDRTITADEAEDYHGVQLATLRSAGVDLVTAMTFNNVAEAVGVARAAAEADLPLALSFAAASNGRLVTGPSLREAIEAVDDAAGEARPALYGVNCAHPIDFEPGLEPGSWLERLRMLRPNASAAGHEALCTLGHLDEGDPVDLGARMGSLAERLAGVDIWGGCCGTWDKHLDVIAGAVGAVRRARVASSSSGV